MVQDISEVTKKLPKGWSLDKYFVGNGKRDFPGLYDFVALVREGRREFLVAEAFMPGRSENSKHAKTVRLIADHKGFEVQTYGEDLRSPTNKRRIDSVLTAAAVDAFVEACAL
jgi:hypothetical protein